MTKKCSKCGEVKPRGEFYVRKDSPCGSMSRCKACVSAHQKARYYARGGTAAHQVVATGTKKCTKCDVVKAVAEFTKTKATADGYYSSCKDCRTAHRKEHRADKQAYDRVYNLENAERKVAYAMAYRKERLKSDVQYKLRDALGSRLRVALRGRHKAGSAVRDLGCSIAELKLYLEQRFKPEMSWDNWTVDGWHIDHVRPLSSFDLTDPSQVKIACNYKNLQPLWAKENIAKGGCKREDTTDVKDWPAQVSSEDGEGSVQD